jgi:hypothetical protein
MFLKSYSYSASAVLVHDKEKMFYDVVHEEYLSYRRFEYVYDRQTETSSR